MELTVVALDFVGTINDADPRQLDERIPLLDRELHALGIALLIDSRD